MKLPVSSPFIMALNPLCPQQGRPRQSAKISAFTLVEILVVLAIVALIAVLLFPAIGKAKVSGQRAACMANMRQIGTAMVMFANENEGYLPETTHSLGVQFQKAWIYTLAPYLSNVDEVRLCPADPKRKERLQSNGTSYSLNSFVFVPRVDPFGQPIAEANNNLRRMIRPSQTILAFNIADSAGTTVMSDHTHSEGWTSWTAVCADIQPDRFTTSPKKDHSSGSSNILFADGHVESREASEWKELIEKGTNFARPPEE